jgi:hypothetical protein
LIPNTLGSTDDGFYEAAPPEPLLIYQGEVLIDVPILNMPMPSRWLLLRTRSGATLDVALKQGLKGGLALVLDSNQSKEKWYTGTEGDFAMARLSKRPVLVVSQNCDISTKEFIHVVPIFDVDGTAEHIQRLRDGLIMSAFWLKAHPPELGVESFADLQLIQPIHRSYIKRVSPEQHFRLTDDRIRRLQSAITRYFGRPNSYDAETDVCPRTGTYLCTACFFLDGIATAMERIEGQRFEECPDCKGKSWILQGRPKSTHC